MPIPFFYFFDWYVNTNNITKKDKNQENMSDKSDFHQLKIWLNALFLVFAIPKPEFLPRFWKEKLNPTANHGTIKLCFVNCSQQSIKSGEIIKG